MILTRLQQYGGGSSVTIYAKEDSETEKLNAALKEKKAASRKGNSEKRAIEDSKEQE